MKKLFCFASAAPEHMKGLILLAIFMFMFSCVQKSDKPLSDQQKTKLEEEIRPVISQIFESAKQANAGQVLDVFWNSNEFVYVGITGESTDYGKFEGIVKQSYASRESEVFSKGTEKYTFIDEAAVLWTYVGSVTVTEKNGGVLRVDPFGITMLLKKVNEKWKVGYLHESGQLPIQAETSKPK